MRDDESTVAKRLRKARLGMDLSQAALAKKAGLSQSAVGNIEAGLRVGPGSLQQLAEATGVRLKWLRSGEGSIKESVQPRVVKRKPGEPPAPDFTAKDVTESQWQTLQDIAVLPHEERENLLSDIEARAAKWRAITEELVARRLAETESPPKDGKP